MKRTKKMVLAGFLAVALMANAATPAFATNITIPTVAAPATNAAAAYRIATTVTNGTIDSGSDVVANGNKTVTYKANDGYQLQSVVVDGIAQDIKQYPTSYTFTQVNKNHDVKVVFAKAGIGNQKNITLSVINGTIDKSEAVAMGSNKVVHFKGNTGYYLASVVLDGVAVPAADLSKFASGTYTFANVTAHHSLQVVYEKGEAPANTARQVSVERAAVPTASTSSTTDEKKTEKFLITTKAEHGTITDSVEVEKDGSKTISYSADKGFHLAKLVVDGDVKDIKQYPSSYTFDNVREAHYITATYEKDEVNRKPDSTGQYSIKATAINGTINGSSTEVNFDVKKGEKVEITYKANDGYRLKSLTVDDNAKDIKEYKNSYTFSEVDSNHVLKVEFEKISTTYTIKTSANNGTITGNATVNEGESKTIEYSAKSGYTLKSIKVDGKEVSIKDYPNKYTFSDVKENHEIVVDYQTVAATSSTGKTRTVTPSTTSTTRQGSNAKTGDTTNILLYVLLAGASLSILTGGALWMRRKSK